MDLFVESLKRLYSDSQINQSTLLLLIEKGIITKKDKKYIEEYNELKEGE